MQPFKYFQSGFLISSIIIVGVQLSTEYLNYQLTIASHVTIINTSNLSTSLHQSSIGETLQIHTQALALSYLSLV